MHLNKASPFVDQNQAYGSTELVGLFLREGDGSGGFSGRLLAGAPDPSNPAFALLPNLRELIQHHWANDTVFTDASLPGGSTTFRAYFPGLVDANGVIDQTLVPGLVSNFMGSGYPLLLDTNPFINLLDHYIAGDGRTNENISLTAIHTVWSRNHNFHVEGLLEAGFVGTSEELFQAAKLLNETEYQRVVFEDFPEMLLGGLRGDDDHGFDEYNPNVDARISYEFATAAYRFGHSLIGQTMTVLDPQGQPTQVALFDAFLNPTNDPGAFTAPLPPGYVPAPGYAQLGINAILGGIVTQPAEEVDVNLVDAVRNDLVRINADLFAFDIAREWDVGLGTMNQVRADLLASQDPYVREAVSFAGDLTPYSSWEDFQARNGLSDTIIEQFRQAHPDLVLAPGDIAAFQAINPDIVLGGPNHDTVKGIDRVDLFVGGLAEQHINGGIVGQTFWAILHEQFDRLQEGDRFYYLDRVDDFDFYENIVEDQTFAAIMARNTGLTNLFEDIFATSQVDDNTAGNNDDDNPAGNNDDVGEDDDIADNDDDDEEDDDTAGNDDDEEEDDDTAGNDDDDEEDDDTADNDDDEDDDDDDIAANDDDDEEDDDCDGGPETDSLDLSAITANLASSSESGTDTTAAGDVVKVECGAGDDIFRFPRAEGADGDRHFDVEPGDRLDFRGVDADAPTACDQNFMLKGAATAATQLREAYETRSDGDCTVVADSVDAGADEDFRIGLTLNNGQFML